MLRCELAPCVRSAVLAHLVLKERLNVFGIVGCMLCIVGSITIVLHAPEEQEITSLLQVWRLALQPGKRLASQQCCPACDYLIWSSTALQCAAFRSQKGR